MYIYMVHSMLVGKYSVVEIHDARLIHVGY